MKYLHPVGFIPNDLITDKALHYTTKRVAAVLILLSGRKGKPVRITFKELSNLAHCSPTTAQQAVGELLASGYITKQNCYRFSAGCGCLIYDANRYLWIRRRGGYTMIRKEILKYDVTASAFCNLLFLYRCAGSSGRAFPSLRRLAGRLKLQAPGSLSMPKSTVCAALKALQKAQAVVRHLCSTKRNCLAANSYYMTNMVFSKEEARPIVKGSPIIDKPNIINQITGDYTFREEKDWLSLIEILGCRHDPDTYDNNVRASDLGILVFAGEEQELLA